jgi:uncharacterized protein YkwD
MRNIISIHILIISLGISVLSCKKDEVINYIILEDFEQDIIQLVNEYRVAEGYNTLQLDSIVRREARIHSINMATGKTAFGHDGYLQRAETIFNEAGGTSFGENVAEGNYPTADYFIDSWLNSPSHKENIEADFNYTGVGVAKTEKGSKYCTQIFLKK